MIKLKMVASKNDINRWLQQAVQDGADYVISVCDAFSFDDYPVFCETEDEMVLKYKEYSSASMQKINEVYYKGEVLTKLPKSCFTT